MNYRDLSIHQRITAKGNALFHNVHYRKVTNLLARVSKQPPLFFGYTYPLYAITFKTNYYDPTPYETRY